MKRRVPFCRSPGQPVPRAFVSAAGAALPRVFGTVLETIPSAAPYLHPDPAKFAQWRHALGDTTSLKVGVVWAGNPMHKGDWQRSLAADMVLPRLIMPGVKLYGLQKEMRPADGPVLASLGADVVDLAPLLDDFADTAAVIAALDLVIAVDTSVAHLAGALGRPVWMLLPHALDWRWLRDREDSPWYPTMRLFRQRKQRVWDDVLARVPAELARVVAGERQLLLPPSSPIGASSERSRPSMRCCISSTSDGFTWSRLAILRSSSLEPSPWPMRSSSRLVRASEKKSFRCACVVPSFTRLQLFRM